jgi:hypothetical protein
MTSEHASLIMAMLPTAGADANQGINPIRIKPADRPNAVATSGGFQYRYGITNRCSVK